MTRCAKGSLGSPDRGTEDGCQHNLPNFNAPVAQLPERDASNVGDEGESPSGSANFIYDLRFTIFAALAQPAEAPRSERGG